MEILQQVIYTLNTIPVSGKDNLDKLLGCINALESICRSLTTSSNAAEGGEKNGR